MIRTMLCSAITLLTLCSCGSKSSTNSTPTSFVIFGIEALGVSPITEAFSTTALNVKIEGCSTSESHTARILLSTKPSILNLKQGETGCVATLSSIEILHTTGVSDTLLPATESPFATASPVVFKGQTTSTQVEVSKGLSLSTTLAVHEHVTFKLLPRATFNTLPWTSAILIPADSSTIPTLGPSVIRQRGTTNGTIDLEFWLQCDTPLVLWRCNSGNIYDYRFRIVEKPATLWSSEAEIAGLFREGIDPVIAPNTGSLWGNGFRIVVTFPGTTSPDLAVISRYQGSSRVFIIPAL